MSAAIDKVLQRLHGVKRTAPGRWIALSPTRDERSPSLSIRVMDDGTVLLHDFGGDSVDEILGCVGLTFADLFPERQQQPGAGRAPTRRPFSASDLIELAAFEASVCVIVTHDILVGKPDADHGRLIEAARRLTNIWEATNAPR